ncbi:unnamed protein product [Allacma fusca]|uniref:Uncharacterized protein n=1 Tax=Allacma fusca TaxID=39272 RepID=A0A8J2P5J1_9HEXA|nr:unnamed protein product [Allacma fusca]
MAFLASTNRARNAEALSPREHLFNDAARLTEMYHNTDEARERNRIFKKCSTPLIITNQTGEVFFVSPPKDRSPTILPIMRHENPGHSRLPRLVNFKRSPNACSLVSGSHPFSRTSIWDSVFGNGKIKIAETTNHIKEVMDSPFDLMALFPEIFEDAQDLPPYTPPFSPGPPSPHSPQDLGIEDQLPPMPIGGN